MSMLDGLFKTPQQKEYIVIPEPCLLVKTDTPLEVTPTYYFRLEDWSCAVCGQHFEAQKIVTLSGAAENIDLIIPFAFKYTRVELFSNDATAKSLKVQVLNGNVNVISYADLCSITSNTSQSVVLEISSFDKYVYIQSPIRLRIAISASTAGKTLTIKHHGKLI